MVNYVEKGFAHWLRWLEILMLNLKAILMALSGVVVVGGIGTYVVLENRKSQEATVVVSAPATPDKAVKDEAASVATDGSSGEAQPVDKSESTTQQQATGEPALPTANWVMPAFDLLRVEPDGSTVIAGRGQPNTKLKIMNGDEMIAETEVGSSGDFVVIFDEPLNSGDYQLSLKVEDENGSSLTSEETAIVSVPKDASGQLLAMVQKPGQASRIITQPEVAANAETASAATQSTDEPQKTPTTDVVENTSTTEEASEKTTEVASNVETSPSKAITNVETATSNAEIATNTETAVETTTETAKDVETKIVETAPQEGTNTEEKSVEVAANNATEDTTPAETLATSDASTTEIKSADAKDTIETAMEKVAEGAVETVEKAIETTEEAVETAKIATETAVEKVVDETENTIAALTSENSDRTDNSGNNGSLTTSDNTPEQSKEEKMEAKAVGPVVEKPVVEKPKAPSENVRIEAVEVEGDKLFVAGSGTAGYQVRVFADGEEVGVANVESNGRFIIEATKDLDVGQHKITAALEDKQTNQVILRAIVPFNRPEGQALAAVASNEDTKSEAKPKEASSTEAAMVKEESEQADNAAATSTKTEGEIKVAANSETPSTSETSEESGDQIIVADNQTSEKPSSGASEAMTNEEVTKQPEDTTGAASETPKSDDTGAQIQGEVTSTTEETVVASTNDNQPSEPKTIVQDELQPANSQSVIIRRGDTLWQIARRTYGAGVRYTTIYLANQQQIENPDRIAPGQIFEVPEEALDNAEELHRQRLGLE